MTQDDQDTGLEFRSVVEAELDAMYRTALRMLRDRDEAEDAVQEALHKAWRKVQLHEAGERMKPWLFRIVVNTCLDYLRTRSRRPTVPYDQEVHQRDDVSLDRMAPDDHLSNKQLGHLIDAEIASLSEEHRSVVQLVIVEQFSYDDAATALGVPVGTVRSRLSRARAHLDSALRPVLEGMHSPDGSRAAGHLKLVK